MTQKELLEHIKKIAGDTDLLHRYFGGNGLTIHDLEITCEKEAEVPV